MTDHAFTDPPGMPEDERMTDAELKVVREWLGLSLQWLADHLGVSLRTVQHWEQGKYAIPDGVRLTVEQLETTAAQQVTAGVTMLMDVPDPVLGLPRECPADCPWPPSWHRAIAARIAQEVTGLSMVYADTSD
ncbi:helix-turn-helix domain-containing protein [Nonomuraea typhae]|uniref:Helix-turn-helix domain-containing protein n=1 Tax=Nonomuraea typhae TaxID=2603600 RepID=A0ABW7YM09_9ACTN